MNLAIFGATGGTGMSLVEQALNAGHTVRALARTPEKLDTFGDRVAVVQGDVLDKQSVTQTITPGTDAVLSSLGAPPFIQTASVTLRRGMGNILSAMRAAGTQRLLAVSASALHVDSHDNLLLRIAKPLVQRRFAKMYEDVRAMEAELEIAPCDWTIVVAPQLNDKPLSGRYRMAIAHNVRNGFSISRPDLARSMLDLISNRSAFRELVFVAN